MSGGHNIQKMIDEIEKYKLHLIDKNNFSCSIKLVPNIGKALLQERRKLYIISNGTEILYVGETNTSIKKRFQRGSVFYNYYKRNDEQKARGGYKGYKWFNTVENIHRELDVLAIVFHDSKDGHREFVEAVEGELVYLVRHKTGEWPKFQNEIHFSNCTDALETAQLILDKLIDFKLMKK